MAREDNKAPWGPPESGEAGGDRSFLLGVMVIALLLRVVAAWATGAAAPQEIRYITIAEGLLDGRGFAGLDTRFPDIIQPPVAIGLLALSLILLPWPLVAARGLSVASGVLVIIPIFAMTRRLFGRPAARRAAWLATVYPLLVHLSSLGLTEPPFTLLVALAALCLLRAADGRREGPNLATGGVLLGLSFLVRPEGLAYLPMACVVVFLCSWRSHARPVGRSLRLAAVPLLVFLSVAAPYWIWLKAETGHWLIAPKAVLTQVHNAIMTQARNENWPERYGSRLFYERVKFGLSADGAELRSAEILRQVGLLGEAGGGSRGSRIGESIIKPGHLIQVVFGNLRQLYLDTIKYGLVLPTLVLGFLALGTTARPWLRGGSRRAQGIVLGFVIAGGSWVLSYVHYRFLYPSIVFLIPWMAEGWVKLEAWLATSFEHLRGSSDRELAPVFTILLAIVTAAACLIHVVPPTQAFSAEWAEQAVAGRMLKEKGVQPGVVMALTPVAAFHAGMAFDVLPYAGLQETLAYARRRGTRYLVADMAEFPTDRPQLMGLLDPLNAASLRLRVVLDLNRDPEKRVVVYDLAATTEQAATGPPIQP